MTTVRFEVDIVGPKFDAIPATKFVAEFVKAVATFDEYPKPEGRDENDQRGSAPPYSSLLLTNVRVMASGTEQAGKLLNDPRIAFVDHVPQTHAKHWSTNIAKGEPTPDIWTPAWPAAFTQSTDCDMVTIGGGFPLFSKPKLHLLAPAA